MKRHFLLVAFRLTLAGTIAFTGCQNKEQAQNNSTAQTQTPAPSQQTTASPSPDSVAPTTVAAPATTPAATPASGQKFGYINSGDLLKIMPETKRAEANLEAYVKNLEKQFGGLQSEYQAKVTEFQSQEKTMVDAVKETRIRAIQELEQRLQQSQVSGQQQVAAKRESLFKPILEKAEKAVKDVGKENGYDYIFDTNTGSFVYARESHNIMPLVKAKLGIK